MKKYTVAFCCSSRADYGIVRNYLKLLNADKTILLHILVTGSLLKQKYNHEINMIINDGFNVAKKVPLPINHTNNKNILHAMSICLDKFGTYFYKKKYDLIIILGDRYEMLPIAIAASMQKIPILHIHGGEATYGNYDEFIRHSITKMSTFHIAVTEEYRNRIIQLGENPNRVYNLGSLGAENCNNINLNYVDNRIKELEKKHYFVILFHPETITSVNNKKQINELLLSLKKYKKYKMIFIGTNADTYSDDIRKIIKDYVKKNKNSIYYENLHPSSYHYLLKNSICLIGNSSSGIIEAPSLGIFTINIGNRQAGRYKNKSVIDVKCKKEDIDKAINYVLKNKASNSNVYYKKNALKKYYRITLKLLKHLDEYINEPKKFYNIKFETKKLHK